MIIRLLIAGGRDFSDYDLAERKVMFYLSKLLQNGDEIEIVSGACDDKRYGVHTFTRADGTKVYGADGIGEKIAAKNGWKVKPFPANWKKYGRAAGPIRNKDMAIYMTHGIVFWDKISRGTKSMIDEIINEEKPFREMNY